MSGRSDRLFKVVVFVMGLILVYVLFGPHPPHGREKARQAMCLSSVRQMMLAMKSYTQDYDGRFPPKQRWCDEVKPYVKSIQVFVCPKAQDQHCGYACSDGLPATIKDCPKPAETVMLFDAVGTWNTVGSSAIAAPRHRGMLNVGFVDGHGKAFSSFPSTN